MDGRHPFLCLPIGAVIDGMLSYKDRAKCLCILKLNTAAILKRYSVDVFEARRCRRPIGMPPEGPRRILVRITDQMAASSLPEIKTLRRTLMKWRNEILNYFKTRLTNARTEGFNNVAKLIQKRSYGVKSFENYRLKYLNATA